MKKPITTVTDHAVLRYLERVLEIDIETIRREIGHKVDRGVQEGACGVIVDGFRFRLVDGAVTTVVFANRPERGKGTRRKRRPGE